MALAVATVLTVVAMGACGGADQGESESGAHFLVAYSKEGGIRFQVSRLVVSTEGTATVRSEGCTVRFHLRGRTWHRLRRALGRADLSALAGEYPAPSGAADVIAETIVVNRDHVRVGDLSTLPAQARQELRPLLDVLGEILAEGERQCAR